ncbi:MAG: sugar transferase [Planctomycetota bacterium]
MRAHANRRSAANTQRSAGEMSMIGPRPNARNFSAYLEAIPWYPLRSLCKPGVTGLAQVNGDYHTSAQRKLLYDVSYLANMSPLFDLRILLATAVTVLTKSGH